MLRAALAGLLAGVIGGGIVVVCQTNGFRLLPETMSYADLAAVLLGAAAVLLAIIGVFVAALAVWGFTAFRSMTKNSAKAYVRVQLKQGELRSHVETTVTQFLEKEFESAKLRGLLEDRLDELLVTAPSDRVRETPATANDTPIDDL